MKHPVFFASSLVFTMAAFSLFMIFVNSDLSFFKDPFSVVGNLPTIYPLFVALGSLISLSVGAFVYGAFSFFDKLTKKIVWYVIMATISGMLLVIIPYNKEQLFFRWIHTVLAVEVAIIIVLVSFEFNRLVQPKKRYLAFAKKYAAPALSIGTFTLFIISGITMLMESYFIIIASIWLIVVGISVKEKQSTVKLLNVEDKP